MRYEEAYSFLITKLESELAADLTYHNTQHTLDVIAAAEKLAHAENITSDDLILLKTAALFHDAGFLQQHEGHEEISCNIAREHLPVFGYSKDEIERICKIIMATKVPQMPADHLCKILCDADLYYIGTDEYTVRSEKLYQELKNRKIVASRAEWVVRQIEFLSSHRYFSQTAINQNEKQKLENLNQLKAKLEVSFKQKKTLLPLELVQDFLLMAAGVIIAGLALKRFLVPNRFFDGGITGLALLLHEIRHYNLAIVIVLLNLPLIIISYFSVSRNFAFRTFISVVLLGICLWLIPEAAATQDKLLVSIFGGVFLGIGIGLIMRVGAALDGIEVLALYTLKKTSFTITEIILGINILIFAIAAFKFGLETALYSILTYFAATRTIDYVVEGLQAYTGVTIISGKSEVIKYQLVNNLNRGITVYKGERGFLPGKFEISSECDIIFTVITRLELRKLKNLVAEVDPHAFVFASTIKEASGGIIRRKSSH